MRKQGDKIVVKPNILNVTDVEATDLRVIYAVSKIFRDIGCSVTVGENPLVGTRSSEVFEKMRVKEVAEKAGARFVDFRRDEQVTVDVPNARGCSTLRIAKTVLEADLLVSVPAMKHHGLCNVTLGLKNMWGVIGPTQRRLGHLNSLNWTLAELNRILGVRLTIIDGLIGVGYSEAFPLGLIIAGNDPVATDAVACLRMGFDPMRIEHIRYSHELGLGEIDPKKIELVGTTFEQLVKEGKAARKIFVHAYADYVLRGEAGREGLKREEFLRYTVSGYQIHNAVGLWCYYGSMGLPGYHNVVPTSEDIEAALRNHVRIWRTSQAWSKTPEELERFDREYYGKLARINPDKLRRTGSNSMV